MDCMLWISLAVLLIHVAAADVRPPVTMRSVVTSEHGRLRANLCDWWVSTILRRGRCASWYEDSLEAGASPAKLFSSYERSGTSLSLMGIHDYRSPFRVYPPYPSVASTAL